MIKLVDHITGTTIVNRLEIQSTFLGRLRGYTFSEVMEHDAVKFFLNTRRVHTFGMFFPLDIYYFDDSLKLLGFKQNVKPNRIPVSPKGTKHVMEVPSANLRSTIILNGEEQLSFVFGGKH